MRYWSRRPLVTRDEAVSMLEKMVSGLADGTWHSWAVTLQGDDTPVGLCSLFNFVTGCRRAERGYILARERWGRGVMTEALGSVIAHAFGPLGLRRLEADADPRNAGSLRLLTRLGFVMIVFCAGVLAWTLYTRFFTHDAPQGWTSVLAVVLLLGGIQMLGMGIVGQYIARIFEETKQRPLYFVAEIVERGETLLSPAATTPTSLVR